MAGKLFMPFIRNPIKPLLKSIFINCNLKNVHTKVSVKEVKIPMKWGHIAGRLWGNEHERPILALHGWRDNAGTWDTFAPLLCNKRPILAIDFYGHGNSSWIPDGMQYNAWDLPRIILQIKDYFHWDKVSLLGHSKGAVASLRFACLFPESVDFYIAVEFLILDDHKDLEEFLTILPNLLKKGHVIKNDPPVYTMDEIIQMWHLGSSTSVSIESVPHLINRATRESSKVPNKYYFTQDPRLKYCVYSLENKIFIESLVKRLKCPTLYIKGMDSMYATNEFSVYIRELIAKNNSEFECQFLPGTHHLHLNNPTLILPYIIKFLENHKFLK